MERKQFRKVLVSPNLETKVACNDPRNIHLRSLYKLQKVSNIVNEDTLRELGIKHWNEISVDFSGADLFLGNGFSLNFSSVFGYESLFDEFLQGCEPKDRKLFSQFGTTNFETIQERLLNAKKVNQILELPTEPIDPAIRKLRQGLITSVQKNHPLAYENGVEDLRRTSENLDPFEDIYTLNYDLFLYRIIMMSKDRSEKRGLRRHNDYFWEHFDFEFLEFKDFDIYENKHVYYLHGALFLFPGERLGYHNDLKIKRGDQSFDELIDVVSRKVEQGILPLFVSEGKTEEKLRVISKSPYLRFAHSKLEEAERPLVIYGWSISPQDKHILGALKPRRRPKPKRTLAVSVYVGSKTQAELEEELSFMKARLSGHKLVFFDSSTLFAS